MLDEFSLVELFDKLYQVELIDGMTGWSAVASLGSFSGSTSAFASVEPFDGSTSAVISVEPFGGSTFAVASSGTFLQVHLTQSYL